MPLFSHSVYIILFELDPVNNVNRYVSGFLNRVIIDIDVQTALDAALDRRCPSRRDNLSCYGCRKKSNGPLQTRLSHE